MNSISTMQEIKTKSVSFISSLSQNTSHKNEIQAGTSYPSILTPACNIFDNKFWDNVVIKDEQSCWIWKRCKDKDGYGKVRVYQKTEKAHRIAYQLINGSLSLGQCVLHKCDNPACCNPNHLVLGSHQDNVVDRVKKGRSAKGEQHGRSKLKISDIYNIRLSFLKKEHSILKLSDIYHIDRKQIKNIINNINWKDI